MHKVPGVREAIEARGATVPPFPAYSPDLNPIEFAFSKLRQRSAPRRADPPLNRVRSSVGRSRAFLHKNVLPILPMQDIGQPNRNGL